MASKHDAKRARENMWVCHQNLAKAKGGRPGYQFKERRFPVVVKPVAQGEAAAAPSATTAAPLPNADAGQAKAK